MATRARVAAACAAVVLAPAMAACSGAPGTNGSSTARPPSSSTLVATRWWSNSASRLGSTIDAAHPRQAAARLHASRADYCGMLRQTVAAGRSVLPGATANDPALLTSTEAFIAELEAVAPPAVARPWKILGDAVLALVASGGDTAKVKGVDAAAVRAAVDRISAQAKRDCGVDLGSAPSR